MPDIVFDRKVDRHFTSIDDLRALVPAASGPAAEKEIDHVDDLSARFIAAAPLAIMATRRASGQVDVTPRGDPPGFVRVLDRNTLALPDRPGNRRLDAMQGILETGAVSLLFCIPGHRHTLRVTAVRPWCAMPGWQAGWR